MLAHNLTKQSSESILSLRRLTRHVKVIIIICSFDRLIDASWKRKALFFEFEFSQVEL
jgi:hypothetical protein